jgi:hypothetical protein
MKQGISTCSTMYNLCGCWHDCENWPPSGIVSCLETSLIEDCDWTPSGIGAFKGIFSIAIDSLVTNLAAEVLSTTLGCFSSSVEPSK